MHSSITNVGRALRWIICLLLCCFSGITLARAVDRQAAIAQLHHTTWGFADGLPGKVADVKQTSDGFIWVLTRSGVYRFDGMRFESLEMVCQCKVKNEVPEWIYASNSGAIWIGSRTQVSRMANLKIVSFPVSEACGQSEAMIVDLDGGTWLNSNNGLCKLDASGKFALVANSGVPPGRINDIFLDRQGKFWLKSSTGEILFRERGAPDFHKSLTGSSLDQQGGTERGFAQTLDGRMWYSGAQGLRRIYEGADDMGKKSVHYVGPVIDGSDGARSKQISLLGTNEPSGVILGDREGTLWLAVREGLLRFASPSDLSQYTHFHPRAGGVPYTPLEGLSSDVVWSLLEDREGNVWAATNSGLDQFSSQAFQRASIPMQRQTQAVIGAGEDGSVWAGNFNTPPVQLINGEIRTFPELKGPEIAAVLQGSDHTVWVAKGGHELWKGRAGRFRRVEYPERWKSSRILAMANGPGGSLWVSFLEHGLYRLDGKTWEDENKVFGFPENSKITSLGSDASGVIWTALRSTLYEYKDSKLYRFDEPEFASVSNVLQVYGRDVWLGGAYRLSVFRDGVLHVFRGTDGEDFRGTSGIVETSTGDVWLNGPKGAVLISAGEVENAIQDPNHEVFFRSFDKDQGIDGYGDMTYMPNAVLGSDGRIWMGTNKGVFSIDPRVYAENLSKLPPSVVIDTLNTTLHSHLPFDNLQLPPRSSSVDIRYTALSFAFPEKLQFRYQLKGVDHKWQMVGTRRQASYNSLAPGDYSFLVDAMNSDGIWNERGVGLSFRVLPAYYQTWWFRSAGLLVLAFVTFLLFRAQLRRSNQAITERLAARLQERERIARELHDTLLQGFHGLMLRFQVVSKLLETPSMAAPVLNDALDRADMLLVESRERIRDLRYESEQIIPLLEALTAAGEQMCGEHQMSFQSIVDGVVMRLNPLIREEMYLVGREALMNAFRHSKGNAVECELTFHPHWVRLRIRDDGQGVSPETLRSSGTAGHWGLAGMFERAERIGAQFRVWNKSGSGCEVELRVPAIIAYPLTSRTTKWTLLKRRFVPLQFFASTPSEESEL
jgi:signal transduction histidine kinase/ligand-binding sensor domain-containing protein